MSDYQYLIHEYLEGTLSEELQTSLFQEMSGNEALRHELLLQIHLQQQAQHDFAALTAPDDVKESLFIELGLSEPANTAPIITPSATATGTGSLMSQSIATVSTLCLGALIGWYVHSLQPTQQYTDNISIARKYSPQVSAIASSSTLPTTQKIDRQTSEKPSPTVSQKNIPVVPRSLFSEDKNRSHEQIITSSETPSIIPLPSLNTHVPSMAPRNNQTLSMQSPPTIQQLYFEDYAIITRFSTLYPLGNNSFSGQIVQVLYALEDNNSIGVEYSTGTYSLPVNELYDGEFRTIQQSRQFSAYSIAASHRMDYAELFDIIPVSTMSIGSTVTGEPIGRISAGLSWTPEQRVSLCIGTDISTIAYRKAGTWQSTSAIALMGSLSVRF